MPRRRTMMSVAKRRLDPPTHERLELADSNSILRIIMKCASCPGRRREAVALGRVTRTHQDPSNRFPLNSR
jgi:hypothetical protein